ncbi:peptidase inhibitor family I36 protein [Streptomyces sp. NPDC020875]|uniref:peptidase inhibitor family I36 protein n=1 Tax=Streptomyces sp. NPDC020875 TaxID=3154898 RepID=UPI003406761A
MRPLRVLVPIVTALCAMVTGVTTASAAQEPGALRQSGTEARAEDGRQQGLDKSRPIIADYKGKKINLAKGWQGAQACSEVPSGRVYCYDTAEEADRALAAIAPEVAKGAGGGGVPAQADGQLKPSASRDCAFGWVCLWEHSDFTGRRLQWSAKGTKQLGDWNFRDKASAGCVNRSIGGALVYDARTAMPDPYFSMHVGYCYDFTSGSYPTGGNWNDKADYMEM